MHAGKALVVATALAITLLTSAHPAWSALEVGEGAPALEARVVAGREPADLARLRGRVVLIEIFSTSCGHCRAFVPRLNAWQARYAERGLTILAVTRDDRAAVERFRRTQGVRFPLAVVPTGTLRAYRVARYPEITLLSALGEVAFSDHAERLTDGDIQGLLRTARPQPAVPATLRWIPDALSAGRYGAVREELAARLACSPARDPACAPIQQTHAWIAWYGDARLSGAARRAQRGDAYEAWRVYDEVARGFGRHAEGRRAAAALVGLLADAATARAIAAGRALQAAHDQARRQRSEEAAALYRAVGRTWPGTRAAKRAARIAAALERRKS